MGSLASNLISLLLLGLSVSVGNFFASIGIGLTPIKRNTRIKILVLFGFFELVMPLFGLMIGAQFSNLFSSTGKYVCAGFLLLLGAYDMFNLRNKGQMFNVHSNNKRLMLVAFALSLDNLIIGFAFGSYDLPILFVVAFIAIISVSLSAIGLQISRRFGKYVIQREGLLLGVMLMLLGLFIALG